MLEYRSPLLIGNCTEATESRESTMLVPRFWDSEATISENRKKPKVAGLRKPVGGTYRRGRNTLR